MKIGLITVVTWVTKHWSTIAKVVGEATRLVQGFADSSRTGAEKRLLVFQALSRQFTDLGAGWINVVIELVVAVLKWKGKL